MNLLDLLVDVVHQHVLAEAPRVGEVRLSATHLRDPSDESHELSETFEIAGSGRLTFIDESMLSALDLMSRQMEDAKPEDDVVGVFSPGIVKFTGSFLLPFPLPSLYQQRGRVQLAPYKCL